jgi:hypothetical protein
VMPMLMVMVMVMALVMVMSKTIPSADLRFTWVQDRRIRGSSCCVGRRGRNGCTFDQLCVPG